MTHAIQILFEPLLLHIGVKVSTAFGEIGQESNQTRTEATFGKQVHFDFLYDDELIVARHVET